MEVTIRSYERRDAADVADVFYRSVREVALSDYTPTQVNAWVPRRWDAEKEHQRSGDGRLVLVAEGESGHVVAFIDLEPDGHMIACTVPRKRRRRCGIVTVRRDRGCGTRPEHQAAVHGG